MEILKAPERSKWVENHHIKVFLAGSIEMGTAEDWQSKVIEAFSYKHNLSKLAFLNPRRDDWDSSWEQKESNIQFNEQVNWEMDMLNSADYIFMYFSPGTKSPISLLELGLYANTGKLIVCCPDDFWRKGNVDIVCSRYSIPVYENLDKAIGRLMTELKHIENTK